MTASWRASVNRQRSLFAEASINPQGQFFAEVSANLQWWRFADPSANPFAEASHQAVIPDLVSEERAESVGNPCLNVGCIKAGEEQPIPGAVAFRQVEA
jgi:hypothetical protein